MYHYKTGEEKSLDELIRFVLDRWMDQDKEGLGKLQGNPELAKLSNEEKKGFRTLLFVEKSNKDLNFDRL